MEGKLLFCVLVFIIAQYWISNVEATKTPASKSKDSSACQNDTDCSSGLRCYTERCYFGKGKSASKGKSTGSKEKSASGGKCKPEFVTGCDDRYGFFTECLEYTDEFKRIPEHDAHFLHSEKFPGPFETPVSCKEHCMNDTTCINFNFNYDENDCYLLDTSLNEMTMYGLLHPYYNFDFYARVCLYC